jgi:pimeloyl-ACP methyl ester carboxylesterase
MEITESLEHDLQQAPEWFHASIAIQPRLEDLQQPLGNLKYQVWNRKNTNNIVVLIHGTGAHKKWWNPIAPLFNQDFTVIAPDLPGMGESDHRVKYDFKAFSDSLLAILDQEQVTTANHKIYFVGHSLGGHLAGFMASELPELAAGLIMIDSPIRPPSYNYDEHRSTGPLRKIKYYEDKISILERFRLMPPQDCKNSWYLRYIAEHSIQNVDSGWRWRFDDKLFATLKRLQGYEFNFQCPSLFIAGGKSLLLGSKIMSYIKEEFKDRMSIEVIKHAAHHIPLDEPLGLIKIINAYLDQWSAK